MASSLKPTFDSLENQGIRYDKPSGDALRYYLGEGNQGVMDQFKFGNSLEPQRQANINSVLNFATPGGQQTFLDSNRRALEANAGQSGQEMANRLAQSGGGLGVQQGAILGAHNSAEQAANQIQTGWASPDGQMKLQQLIQSTIASGQQSPLFQQLMPLLQLLEQGHMQQNALKNSNQNANSFGSILSGIGGLAGAYGDIAGAGKSSAPPSHL